MASLPVAWIAATMAEGAARLGISIFAFLSITLSGFGIRRRGAYQFLLLTRADL
jgi:hypothetical protein